VPRKVRLVELTGGRLACKARHTPGRRRARDGPQSGEPDYRDPGGAGVAAPIGPDQRGISPSRTSPRRAPIAKPQNRGNSEKICPLEASRFRLPLRRFAGFFARPADPGTLVITRKWRRADSTDRWRRFIGIRRAYDLLWFSLQGSEHQRGTENSENHCLRDRFGGVRWQCS